jgi:hypothetical protein
VGEVRVGLVPDGMTCAGVYHWAFYVRMGVDMVVGMVHWCGMGVC